MAYRPFAVLPGVQPTTDGTPLSIRHWRDTLHCRFVDGYLQKIGGWIKVLFFRGEEVSGVPRSMFSIELFQRPNLVIGTNTRLYNVNGGQLFNITPLDTTSLPAPSSLSTQYGLLANNPFTMVNGSNRIVVADADVSRLRLGDSVTLSGAAGAVRGIPQAQLNAQHVIREIIVGGYAIRVASNATSSGTGGGATINRASGLLRATVANTLTDGDRVRISGATDTGGILAADINDEHITRNVTAAYFDFMTDGTATSSVTTAGGASTVYFPQLPAGTIDELALQGYGAGLYGVGLYGTALSSNSGRIYPRVWYFDRYGEDLIATPGNGEGVYRWNGQSITAPSLVANAPTDVNYAFVSDNTLVTFGSDGIENRIAASDQGNITQWVSSSTNQVFRDDIEGAGRLLSHVPVRGNNLIFTETQTYTFRKISLEAGVWEIKLVDPNIGIISSQARASVRGFGYFMSKDNFYMYRGANLEIIPSNNPSIPHCTALKYIFSNLNTSQKSKIFARYDPKFDELTWHYPSASSMEPDRTVTVNLTTFVWSIDKIERTAAEYPSLGTAYPRLADFSGNVYLHEVGNDDNGVALPFMAKTCLFTGTEKTSTLSSFVPDSIQSGDVTVDLVSRLWPQSTKLMYNKTFTVSPESEEIQDAINGRYWDYTVSGNVIDQEFRMGVWQEQLMESSSK